MTISVNSNSAWTAGANQGWIQLSTTAGAAGTNQPLRFSLLQNDSGMTRTGAITVTAGGVSKQFSVTQSKPLTLTITPAAATITIGTSYQFTAYVDGVPGNTRVVWTAGMGSVVSGLYTPPNIDATGFPSTYVTATLQGAGLTTTASIILQNKLLDPAYVSSYSPLNGALPAI